MSTYHNSKSFKKFTTEIKWNFLPIQIFYEISLSPDFSLNLRKKKMIIVWHRVHCRFSAIFFILLSHCVFESSSCLFSSSLESLFNPPSTLANFLSCELLSQAWSVGTAPFLWGKIVKNVHQSLVSRYSRIISQTLKQRQTLYVS